jgi:hypothetical protein
MARKCRLRTEAMVKGEADLAACEAGQQRRRGAGCYFDSLSQAAMSPADGMRP